MMQDVVTKRSKEFLQALDICELGELGYACLLKKEICLNSLVEESFVAACEQL